MLRSKRLLASVFFLVLWGVFYSCKNENTVPEKKIYYSDVAPILASNCAMSGCHDAGTKAEDYDYSTWATTVQSGEKSSVVAGDYKSSKLYEAITSGGPDLMPPSPKSPLTDEQINIIALWIKQGATSETQTTSSSSHVVTYDADVKLILDANCVSCHSSSAKSGSVSYSTYDETLVTAKNGKLLGCVEYASGYSKMPAAGKLSDDKISVIRQWVADPVEK